ncbi:organoarsenical effux MFS transporter ArsJ [Colwellia sp. BRX8-9]|uniref:organoarsenical effux MFS transporter ArsJ n=1 Tax=Colwellia sp. BRX8-9 TaxID=2759831 RepID=UPI0015F3D30A|nr:organoarsenical effux MFS transporter ArsJ [Colwellia sp. BRX8-9]MBA6347675.1 organoarsenical effux MFS transporter ArsJ [Colwellia sp. BRX8-9]
MLNKITALPSAVKQYLLITANYWFFTLTDGALRMLVLLHFHHLGYSPLAIAMLFLFYEVFGVITNLVGGWLGAKIGLNKTMNIGLFSQVFALLMLTVPEQYLTVIWVMLAQALSGIAKDLNKMSAKSSIKTLVPTSNNNQDHAVLFRWVAYLTGSKNALKGIGFFLGAWLLSTVGFSVAMLIMASVLAIVFVLSLLLLQGDLGKAKHKVKFKEIFSNHSSLNYLAGARLFLFAARDIWFVVGLPIYLVSNLGWQHTNVGIFMALWIIAYGIVQGSTPKFFIKNNQHNIKGHLLFTWGMILSGVTLLLALLMFYATKLNISTEIIIIAGLFIFGAVFAINSALHSYVIVAMAKEDGVSMDVGFYYMANALGRLLGTVMSGVIYQFTNLITCLIISALFAGLSALLIKRISLSNE